ncbi:hypothetical protein GUJ93_ZPchr0007g5910 [Zizania palustris]|uniref:Uncharacterized protein n=1 Tax=Zizania palustris TaxID=103762 RepID=A0A8J5W6I2_ZIZPA|nr:hypothetical protein GUJ93_ZPchr0007g5910 [Zizania palustris]
MINSVLMPMRVLHEMAEQQKTLVKLTVKKSTKKEMNYDDSLFDKHQKASAVRIDHCNDSGKRALSLEKPQQTGHGTVSSQASSKLGKLGSWRSGDDFYELIGDDQKHKTDIAIGEEDKYDTDLKYVYEHDTYLSTGYVVIREAHERAFEEARERAEKIALERVTASRQQASAEAREKEERASVEAATDMSSREDMIKAERATVERANVEEARERAIEKAKAAAEVSVLSSFQESFKFTNLDFRQDTQFQRETTSNFLRNSNSYSKAAGEARQLPPIEGDPHPHLHPPRNGHLCFSWFVHALRFSWFVLTAAPAGSSSLDRCPTQFFTVFTGSIVRRCPAQIFMFFTGSIVRRCPTHIFVVFTGSIVRR